MEETNATVSLTQRMSQLETSNKVKDDRIRELETLLQQERRKHASEPEKFYVTTAIHYTNGYPHMGHAYENVLSDVISRYHRVCGRDVFFLTGTDEHGQKVAQTAEAAGMKPIEICDKYAGVFQQLAKDLNMSNDDFIRTTSDRHKTFAQWLFQRALDRGDIYLGEYEGWYNVREETFVTETEAKQTDYKDPASGTPFKKMQEKSYFFRMSRYQDQLVRHFETHPNFLQPEVRRQEILRRLEEPLQDLSCSRTTFNHGIPLPNDPEHVMYVWFDALSNYLTALGYPDNARSRYWPASVHVIGKDISWFHSVIWPCILFSTGIPLPERVFAHGFVNAKDGSKMSKSLGNIVDPYEMINKYGLDSFRYFLARCSRFGHDMPFSEDDLMNTHNAELADTLGNLVHRTVSLTQKYADGKVPEVTEVDRPFDPVQLEENAEKAFREYSPQNLATAVMQCLKDTNKYLTDKAPWHMKDSQGPVVVVRTCLEAVYILAHYLCPFMPDTSTTIFTKLSAKQKTLPELSPNFDNLDVGASVEVGEILFQKVLTDEEKKKAEEKEKAKAGVSAKKQEKKAELPLFASLDIRVGVISKVWHHPDSDKLFCEEIDIGEEEPKPIASGLRPFYSLEQMQGRKVLVLLNLKPAKLGGFKSHGMVLCASNESHDQVEFVEPPVDAKVGERVFVDTESGEPVSAAQMKKQKVWEKCAPLLLTNDGKVATYKGEPIKTSAGECVAQSLVNAHIS